MYKSKEIEDLPENGEVTKLFALRVSFWFCNSEWLMLIFCLFMSASHFLQQHVNTDILSPDGGQMRERDLHPEHVSLHILTV